MGLPVPVTQVQIDACRSALMGAIAEVIQNPDRASSGRLTRLLAELEALDSIEPVLANGDE